MSELVSFSEVIEGLKSGLFYARKGWNGKGMFVFLMPGATVKNPALTWRPYICMKDAQDCAVPWLASQTDMLAEDWHEVKP
jgi:Protein of unknown function (DUF2829)